MLSAGEPARAKPRIRLATRVVISAMASGGLAGTLAAVSAVAAVDQLVSRRGDQRLVGAADILAGEIDEGSIEGEWEPLGEIVADENSELVTSGVRLAVFSSTHRIAGDPWVPWTPAGRCETHGRTAGAARACARGYRNWTLVAASHSDQAAQRLIYLVAALASLVIGAGIGVLASVRLTRWALRPLTSLSDAIGDVEPERARPEQLGPPSDCEEVELIRDALGDLLGRSQAALDQAQRFAADAAHELRTPLTVIRGELELLIEETSDASGRAALSRLGRRAAKLEQLVERLLVLASPIERLDDHGEPVALADVVSDVVADLPVDQRARVRVELHGEGLLRGDPALLRSMVANAIDNALKFSGDAEVNVALTEESGAAPEVRIDVRDHGRGVPPEQGARVFEPFFRAEPNAVAGHGLGLSLIAHVARAHGGKAAFVPVGRGACLRLSLPRWPVDPEPAGSS